MKKTFRGVLLLAGMAALFAACGTTRAGYETAPFTVTKQYEGFEVRQYPALTVAATGASGGKDGRFMKLFRYISGANDGKQKIAMTTPVFMDQAEARQEMMFVLPAELAGKAPQPGGEGVSVKTIPARTMAVLRYSGSNSREREKEMEQTLRAKMAAAGLAAGRDVLVAYYDPPWTLPAARRNEILIPVR